ncbi:helix-turn-helix transcriptional regulator [Streptomyces sp. PU-14G]|uniref:helix-turn-helix transcriptional regulator n=1 Tax=Streptomyces sp. PU-14G TaxID=2800808 RepID=UPI0034DDFD45
MRASRLLSILLLLQTRGRVTARELADTLEVSVRTVYRDMAALATAGIPLYGDPGHRGGYQLLAGHRTRLTGLTSTEAAALFLMALPDAAGNLGLGPGAANARLKLLAALPDELRGHADHMAERFHLDTPPWYCAAEHPPYLTAVAEAAWHGQRLRIRYLRWAEPHEVSRIVEPYGVVLKAGTWYVVARHAECFRTYRVSRITAVEELAEPFDRLPDFQLAAHWREYLEQFDARRHRGEATMRVSPSALAHLPYLVEPAAAKAATRTACAGPDGWYQITLPIETAEQALPEVLKLGAEAEVLTPVTLRDRMRNAVRRLAVLYAIEVRAPEEGAARTAAAPVRSTGDDLPPEERTQPTPLLP